MSKELTRLVEKEYKGIRCVYRQSYSLGYKVDEDTGMINKKEKSIYFTTDQVKRNLIALKEAFNISVN